MELLSNESVQNALKTWELVDKKWLQRTYSFQNYLNGVAFVRQVAEFAQEKDHHPHIVIDHTAVTISTSTLDMGGVTDVDTEMAEHVDELFDKAEK